MRYGLKYSEKKVFVHWKLKSFNFLIDTVLIFCERTFLLGFVWTVSAELLFASKGNKSVIWYRSPYLIWQMKSIIFKTFFKLLKVHVLWAIVIIDTKRSAKCKLGLTRLHPHSKLQLSWLPWHSFWPRLFKSWIALFTGLKSIHQITQLVSLILIRRIVIYPVDSAIQRLNNRGQKSSR